MNRLTFLDDRKDEIIKMYNDGKRQRDIAEYFEVSISAISTRLNKWGVGNIDGNRFKRFDNIDKETVERLYWDEQKHPSEIAKLYGCHKQVITNRMKKWGIPSRTKSESRMGKLNPIYNVGHTAAARKKMSDAFANGRKIGFNCVWGNSEYYDTPNQGTVRMRSSWEVKTADYLTSKNINWYYEYTWIDLEHTKYLPDFFLPDLDMFIEVKGRKKGTDVEKVVLSNKLGYNVHLWDGEELLKRGIIDNSGVSSINRKYRK